MACTQPRRRAARSTSCPRSTSASGRVVRLLRGDFDRATVYGDDPVAVARRLRRRRGAGGSTSSTSTALAIPALARRDLVRAIVGGVGESARVEVAGGLRDEASAAAMLAAGAARVVVGTAALRIRRSPAGSSTATARIGSPWPSTSGTAARSATAGRRAAPASRSERRRGRARGRGSRDLRGHRDRPRRHAGRPGPRAARARWSPCGAGAVIASAGISSTGDLRAVRALGCAGAIVGRALYEGRFTIDGRRWKPCGPDATGSGPRQ